MLLKIHLLLSAVAAYCLMVVVHAATPTNTTTDELIWDYEGKWWYLARRLLLISLFLVSSLHVFPSLPNIYV